MTTLSFSAINFVLPLRRIPAVSTKRSVLPSNSTTSSTASRVVPAIGDTMAREVPVSALSNVDLPTFGRPMMATDVSRCSNSPWVRIFFWFSAGSAPGTRGPPSSISSSIASSISSASRAVSSFTSGCGIASAIASSSSPMLWPCSELIGKTLLDAELPKILGFAGERIGLHFIDREKQGLSAALQQAHKVVVGPRQFGAHVRPPSPARPLLRAPPSPA